MTIEAFFREITISLPRSEWIMATGLSETAPDNDLALAYRAIVAKKVKRRIEEFGPWLSRSEDGTVQAVSQEDSEQLDLVASAGDAEVILESISPLTEDPNNLTASYFVEIVPVADTLPPATPVKEASQIPWLFAGIATAAVGIWLLIRGK